jgi:hypothetical protein
MTDLERFAENNSLTLQDATYISRGKSIFCSCGKFKKIFHSPQSKVGKALFRTCENAQCQPMYGRKRPAQSEKMKHLAVSGSEIYRNTLTQRGKKHNHEVNTVPFLKKKLTKKGYDVENLSDVEVKKLNSQYESEKVKSRTVRTKVIMRWLQTWEEEFITLVNLLFDVSHATQILDTLSDLDFSKLYLRLHGIKTLRDTSRASKKRKGWFKSERKQGFKCNTQGKEFVITRSGLEGVYIDFFEENNIPWEYESCIIETIKKDGFHIPDFLIEINSMPIMLEVKGNFYRQEIAEYFQNKVEAAKKYCQQRNIRYVLTTCQKPDLTMQFLELAMVDTYKNKEM